MKSKKKLISNPNNIDYLDDEVIPFISATHSKGGLSGVGPAMPSGGQ